LTSRARDFELFSRSYAKLSKNSQALSRLASKATNQFNVTSEDIESKEIEEACDSRREGRRQWTN